MARPKSEGKRAAILAAAITLIALDGPGAPTSKMAQLAGVAEGTLFTYFASKDELLNQLYLSLKQELKAAMLVGYPAGAAPRDRLHHVWRQLLAWGVGDPARRKVLAQLSTSDKISAHNKDVGMRSFDDVTDLVRDCVTHPLLRGQPTMFAAALLGAISETTLDFMLKDGANAEQYSAAGFETFWHAIAG